MSCRAGKSNEIQRGCPGTGAIPRIQLSLTGLGPDPRLRSLTLPSSGSSSSSSSSFSSYCYSSCSSASSSSTLHCLSRSPLASRLSHLSSVCSLSSLFSLLAILLFPSFFHGCSLLSRPFFPSGGVEPPALLARPGVRSENYRPDRTGVVSRHQRQSGINEKTWKRRA